MSFLQILPDAINSIKNDLGNFGDETFNSLSTKLESLLVDSVGGTPQVTFGTAFDDQTGTATLTVELDLTWDFTEAYGIATNIGGIFGESEGITDILAELLSDIVPDGGGEIEFGTKISYTTAVSIEYQFDEMNGVSTTSCFLLGDDQTGLNLQYIGKSVGLRRNFVKQRQILLSDFCTFDSI